MAMMLLATIAFTVMHAMIRHTAQGLHPFEVAFFRNLFGLVFLAPILFRYGIAPLRTRKLKVHALRGILNLISMLCFFYAVTIAPFADVTALTFTAPIFASVLAFFVLRERVGIARWAAIAIGFLGALVILRPGFGEIGLGPILTVVSGAAVGGRDAGHQDPDADRIEHHDHRLHDDHPRADVVFRRAAGVDLAGAGAVSQPVHPRHARHDGTSLSSTRRSRKAIPAWSRRSTTCGWYGRR